MGLVEKYKALPRRGRLFLIIVGGHLFILFMIFIYPLIFKKKENEVIKHEKIMDLDLAKLEAPAQPKEEKKSPKKKEDKKIPKKDDKKIPKKDDKKIPKKEDKKIPKKEDKKIPKKDDKARKLEEAKKKEKDRKRREKLRKEELARKKKQEEDRKRREKLRKEELARKKEADRLKKIADAKAKAKRIADAKAAKARQSKLLTQYHILCGNLLTPIWERVMPAEHEVNNIRAVAKIRLEISKSGTIKSAYIFVKANDPVLQSCAVKFVNSLKGKKLRSFPQGLNKDSLTLQFPLTAESN